MIIANEILMVLILFMFLTFDKLVVIILNLAVSTVYKVPGIKAKNAPK